MLKEDQQLCHIYTILGSNRNRKSKVSLTANGNNEWIDPALGYSEDSISDMIPLRKLPGYSKDWWV